MMDPATLSECLVCHDVDSISHAYMLSWIDYEVQRRPS